MRSARLLTLADFPETDEEMGLPPPRPRRKTERIDTRLLDDLVDLCRRNEADLREAA